LIVGIGAVGAAVAVVTLGVPGFRKPLRPLGALFASTSSDVITFEVKSADLPVIVTERGTLESSDNIDGYCQVEGQTTIISILPEGQRVKKGDKVCELDSAALKDQLTNQKITTKGAEAAYQNAKLTREVAEIAVVEYVEGIYKQDLENVLGEMALAESEKRRGEDRLEWTKRMLEKGYLSKGQALSEELALKRSNFVVEQAQTKHSVLEKYTRKKTVKELEAEVEKARSDELAKQSTYELEKSKEAKLERQIANCIILAPGDGLIVYANNPNAFGGSTQPQIEEGATVRERQKIFSLPDISKMQVNTKIHESMIDRITSGLRARIRVESFPDSTLTGTVKDIAPLPDPSSFFSSDVKVYTSHVTVDKGLDGLRPGMSAQVEILITQLSNVLSVPVTAVLQFKNKDHLAVKSADGGYSFKDVKLGISNERLVEVREGIKAGDVVALNPVALMSEDQKREAFGTTDKDAVKKDWGDAKKVGNAPPVPVAKSADGKAIDKSKTAKKGAGGRGGMGLPPALQTKFQAIPQEERRALFMGTPEEREATLKKAGFTDDEVKQAIAAFDQMRQRMQQGGGGFGGGGGPGGPGGGGRGGFGGGPGGPGGGGQP
jgi:HlyD family secretion protein